MEMRIRIGTRGEFSFSNVNGLVYLHLRNGSVQIRIRLFRTNTVTNSSFRFEIVP